MSSVEKDELIDYLFNNLNEFEVDEEEKKVLSRYIEDVAEKFSSVYDFIKSDENKSQLIKALEELGGVGNVKRDT